MMNTLQLRSFEKNEAPVKILSQVSPGDEFSTTFIWTINKNLSQKTSLIGLRKDKLWESTVFECFLKKIGGEGYFEIHLDLDLNWNVYWLSHYRSPLELSEQIQIFQPSVISNREQTIVQMTLCLDRLHSLTKHQWSYLNPVIWEENGSKWHFSPSHPAKKPDFHNHRHYLPLSASGSHSNLSG